MIGSIGLVKELLLMQILIWPPASAAPKGEWGLRPFFHLLVGWPLLFIPSMKQPWIKWFPADWSADPALKQCSLAARGLWIEILNAMFLTDLPKFETSIPAMAKMFGSSQQEIAACLAELANTKAAEVRYSSARGNENVTVLCKRLIIISDERERIRLAVQAHRSQKPCNGKVTSASASEYESASVFGKSENLFPPDGESAVSQCMAVGAPRDFILQKWHDAKSVGGLNWRNQKIRSFADHIATEWARERGRIATKGPNGNHQTRQPNNPRTVGVASSSDYGAASDKLAGKIPQRPAA